jgi:hypothetical protein
VAPWNRRHLTPSRRGPASASRTIPREPGARPSGRRSPMGRVAPRRSPRRRRARTTGRPTGATTTTAVARGTATCVCGRPPMPVAERSRASTTFTGTRAGVGHWARSSSNWPRTSRATRPSVHRGIRHFASSIGCAGRRTRRRPPITSTSW